MPTDPPPEVTESLSRFKQDYQDISRTAFIMIEYAPTKPHAAIVKAIKGALRSHRLIGVLAADNSYHDNLEFNVLTYLHGCGLGIAVFERILNDNFNPNVSLEVGYMLALKKPICYLKDQTLPALQSDIGGKIYHPFDTYNPNEAISDAITKWLSGKRLVTPLTTDNLIEYAQEQAPGIDWYALGPSLFEQLKNLRINTMEQLSTAIENEEARKTVDNIYERLLRRKPDWIGIFTYQPLVFALGTNGQLLVEQSVLMSPEYRDLVQKS